MPDSSTDKTYIELDALFKRADDVVATSVIGRPRRGSGYIPKVDAKIRLNAEVMAWLRAMGPRHYSRINGLLTALMEVEKQARESKAETDAETRAETVAVTLTDTESTLPSDAKPDTAVQAPSETHTGETHTGETHTGSETTDS